MLRVHMTRWAARVLINECDVRRELEKILKEKDKQECGYRGWCCNDKIFVGMVERRAMSERAVCIEKTIHYLNSYV